MKAKNLSLKRIIPMIFIVLNVQLLMSQIEINGLITDCEGDSLIGVSISTLKGKINTISDINGIYKIIVPDTNTVITYSYVGYQSQKIKVGNKDTMNVVLKEDKIIFNEEIMIAKKPVIYLYPSAETEVFIKLNYLGELLFTYPPYNNGWNVIASPNGTLKNKKDNKEYSYLFWDGKKTYSETERTYDDGFIVGKDSIISFLQEQLSEFGLKPREYNEFIVFWSPYLMQNDWNFIHFRVGKDYEIISKNIVNPQPETEIRVFMDFKKIDVPFEIEPQKTETPIRKGFTLVEWGGAELKQLIRIKTNSGIYLEK